MKRSGNNICKDGEINPAFARFSKMSFLIIRSSNFFLTVSRNDRLVPILLKTSYLLTCSLPGIFSICQKNNIYLASSVGKLPSIYRSIRDKSLTESCFFSNKVKMRIYLVNRPTDVNSLIHIDILTKAKFFSTHYLKFRCLLAVIKNERVLYILNTCIKTQSIKCIIYICLYAILGIVILLKSKYSIKTFFMTIDGFLFITFFSKSIFKSNWKF